MARTYNRDAKGRFASGGGGGSGGKSGARKASGTLPKTTSARGRARTRETAARAAVKAGGGTKAARSLLTAQRARDYYKATGTGTRRSKTKPRSGIRRTGRLPRPPVTNSIKPYKPTTTRGKGEALGRKVKRTAQSFTDKSRKLKGSTDSLVSKLRKMQLKNARYAARDLANRNRKGIDGYVARFMLREVHTSRDLRAARGVIARRAQRAAAAAARGSKPAARAQAIYDRQLAPVLPKGKGKGRNNIKPGPSNTKGPPKKKRKPRKKR